MATMAADPVGTYIRAHVNFARDMLDGRKPETSFERMMQLIDALEKKHGRDVADAVLTRAKAAVSEVFGGEPAPPLTQAGRDPWPVVEADMLAERLVAELRQAGVPRAGADWKVRLNAAVAARRDLEVARLEKCASAAEEQRKAAAAARTAAAPAPLQHVTLPATVEAVQTRGVPLSYQGTWKPDGDYRPGELTTRDGVLWHCNEPTRDKPGTSQAWTMMHKNLTKAER